MLYSFLIVLFIAATLVQLGYAVLFRVAKKTRRPGNPPDTPVSVIICAKNEALNLQQFLPLVLTQDYPDPLFEVVVVNDGSTDATAAVLANFQKVYAHLKIITIHPGSPKDLPGKKYALAQGIQAAKHDRLLLTDADCRPSSADWIKEMVQVPAGIVLGYGAYENHPGRLNKLVRWETVHTCMQYSSYARAGFAYMGVGRNLFYSRSLWTAVTEDPVFQKTYSQMPSGDDDLLIARMATKANTGICLDARAHTLSPPPRSWKVWWRQKTRHVSTGKYYPSKPRLLLGIYALSHSLYWIPGLLILTGSLVALATRNEWGSGFSFYKEACFCPDSLRWSIIGVWVLFVMRLLLYWVISAAWYRRLGERSLLLFYPLGDLGWAVYNIFLSPYIFLKNRQQWK